MNFIIGAIITAIMTRIGLYQAKRWLAANKDKIKWDVLHTIFGPDPFAPPQPPPPPEPKRRPLLWWLILRRKGSAATTSETTKPALPPSAAERSYWGIVAVGGAIGFALWQLF